MSNRSRESAVPLPIQRLSFGIVTEQLTACRDFYCRYFDFRVLHESAWYVHLRSASAGDLAFLAPGRSEVPPLFHAPYRGGCWINLEVADVEAIYALLAEDGWPLPEAPRTEDWGERRFAVTDPAGVCVNLAQHESP